MICCRHVCPYHASRDVLNEGAALVFVTYSQLLDPPVRSANGLDDLLQGAVLVFDEVLHHLFGQQNTEQSLPPCRLLSNWCYAMMCRSSLDVIFLYDTADAFCRLLVLLSALQCCMQACLACINILSCNAMF